MYNVCTVTIFFTINDYIKYVNMDCHMQKLLLTIQVFIILKIFIYFILCICRIIIELLIKYSSIKINGMVKILVASKEKLSNLTRPSVVKKHVKVLLQIIS